MNESIKAGSDIHAGDGGYSEGTQEEYEKFVKVRNQSLNKARIRQFEKQSGLEIFGLGARREIWEAALEKYAELIVAEMLQTCEDHPGWTGRMIGEEIKQHFGVKEPKGWICPKCNADRTKIACPLGFGATVDGRCPMTVEAQ